MSEPELGLNRASGTLVTGTAASISVRHFDPFVSDEPPDRGGEDRGQTPLELVLMGLCACTNVSTARMAEKLRLTVRIRTDEPDARLDRLADLVGRYCPVDSLIKAAVPDYEVLWQRM